MSLDDLTLGEAKKLAALFGAGSQTPALQEAVHG